MKELVAVNGGKAQMRGLREAVGLNPLETRACEIYSTPVASGLASVEPGEDNAMFCRCLGNSRSWHNSFAPELLHEFGTSSVVF